MNLNDKIRAACTDIGQKREALLDRRREAGVRGELATGGRAHPERADGSGRMRLIVDTLCYFLGAVGGCNKGVGNL